MRLCRYWYIVCFISGWIISEADNPERIEDDNRDVSTPECGEESSFVVNKCEERCECKNGKLTNCHRVRKEFTKMTIEHRKRYINTYKLASVHPLFKKDYEKTVALHLNESNEARLPEVFLPWHRWYLTEFENLLRRIDCRVTIPFWDWSKNIHHWWRGTENDDLWNPEDHGLGGDGSKLDNHCVENGPFSKDKWSLLDVSGGGCLTRSFLKHSLVHDTENVNKTLSLPLEKFNEFEETLRSDYHIEPHFVVGGTMNNPLISANSPELLLHHAFLDKLWYEWQTKGNEYQNVYFPNVPLKFHGSKYYCWEWIDSSNLPGEVKVVYEE